MEEYYREMTSDEYDRKLRGENKDEVDKNIDINKEFNKISNIIKNYRCELSKDYRGGDYLIGYGRYKISRIVILLMQDEWYIVNLFIDHRNPIRYLCDQWDGLLKLLKDIESEKII